MAYFQNRLSFEEQGVSAFDRSTFLEFRDQRQAFSDAETEAQFDNWKSKRLVESTTETAHQASGKAHFLTYLLEENFDLFGSLAAVS